MPSPLRPKYARLAYPTASFWGAAFWYVCAALAYGVMGATLQLQPPAYDPPGRVRPLAMRIWLLFSAAVACVQGVAAVLVLEGQDKYHFPKSELMDASLEAFLSPLATSIGCFGVVSHAVWPAAGDLSEMATLVAATAAAAPQPSCSAAAAQP